MSTEVKLVYPDKELFSMKLKFLFILCLSCNIYILEAQFGCDFIKLCSQAEVDAFPQNYRHCQKFYSIKIDDNCGPVFNLDSLSGLTELAILEIWEMDSLNSISGLNNFRKIGDLHMYQKREFSPFPLLDTIHFLNHIFGFFPSDLSLYKNLKHISRGLKVSLKGYLKGLPEFTSEQNFSLSVGSNNIPNDVIRLIPKNTWVFAEASFSRNEFLSLHGLDSIKTIHYISAIRNKNCDFTALHHVQKVDRLSIISQNMFDVQLGVLSKVERVKLLELYNVDNLKSLDQLLPNLREVNTHVYINENKHLANIDVLNHFDLPKSENVFPLFLDRIKVTNNPNLHDCANNYICRALQVYPDSVSLTGNGFNCEKENLLSSCINSTSIEENDLDILLYPNPAVDKIYWDANHDVECLDVFNIQGTCIRSLHGQITSMDISDLPPGIYFCKMKISNTVVVRKMIKV